MGKVLFVHDGPLYVYKDKFYGIHFTNDVIARYTYFGETITFLMRSKFLNEDLINGYSEITYSGFNHIRVPNFKSISTLHNKLKAERIIEKAVSDHDLIIIRLPSAIGIMAFKYANILKKPILIELVACVFDALWNYNWKGKVLAYYRYLYYRKIIKQTSHIIYVTSKFLQSRYPSCGKSIGCSDVILNSQDKIVLRNRLYKIKSSSGSKLVLGTIAALDVPYKGQSDIIKAIAKLKATGSFFSYKLVGQGDPKRLKMLINKLQVDDLVEILGPLKNKEISCFVDEIDVYVQPSRLEGLPRSVLEAMNRACPVLASNVGGIPELISTESLFPPGDVSAICKLLLMIENKYLEKNAIENFHQAMNFQKEILDEHRRKFYQTFKNDYGLK